MKCYRNIYCIALLVVLAGASSSARSLERGIMEAQELLEAGKVGPALEMLQELRVDYPDAGELRFGIGCAWFAMGEQQAARGDVEEAEGAYAEARSAFGALVHDAKPRLAREAVYNHANCLAREAMLIDPDLDYAGAVAAFRRAVEAYESAIETYPNHAGTRQNLDHVRFQLKRLLQNPPDEQAQPDQPPSTPPTVYSLFGMVDTQLPGAHAEHEDNTAILVLPDRQEERR